MDNENADPGESRPPTVADLLLLCSSLNVEGARYMVVGGLAVSQHGYARATMDIDLLVESSLANQALVKKSLEVLPDKAVREIADDDLNDYVVIRVARGSDPYETDGSRKRRHRPTVSQWPSG